MIVNASNIRIIEEINKMQYPSTDYKLYDLDYIDSTGQMVSVAKVFPDTTNIPYLNFLISYTNIHKIGFDTSITSIKTVAFGKKILVYSGLDSNFKNATFFIVQDINESSIFQSYNINCSI